MPQTLLLPCHLAGSLASTPQHLSLRFLPAELSWWYLLSLRSWRRRNILVNITSDLGTVGGYIAKNQKADKELDSKRAFGLGYPSNKSCVEQGAGLQKRLQSQAWDLGEGEYQAI